jgi:3D (Asp-Asp-Asp) domain-containing protein
MLARVTVYWASGGSGSDHWTRKHIAASGARLRDGHCAVDPRRIPYRSRVVFPDGVLIAVDTGGAVRNRYAARKTGRSTAERNAIVIDRFFETKAQALAWERRHPHFMTVRVFAPNDKLPTTVQKGSGLPIEPGSTNVLAKKGALTRNPVQSGRPLLATTASSSPFRISKPRASAPDAKLATINRGLTTRD